MKTVQSSRNFNSASSQGQQISKAGQWLENNPGGIIEVLDRRAVNR
jgi:hypothetical protein